MMHIGSSLQPISTSEICRHCLRASNLHVPLETGELVNIATTGLSKDSSKVEYATLRKRCGESSATTGC